MQSVAAEDEERNQVQPPTVDENRGLAIEEVADRTALEWEVLIAHEGDHRREIESTREPRLHLVDPPALDFHRMLTGDHPQVIVDRLADHSARAAGLTHCPALEVDDGHRYQ